MATFMYAIDPDGGEYSEEIPVGELAGLIASETIDDATMIYYEGLDDWYPLADVKEGLLEAAEGDEDEEGGLSAEDWAEAIADLDLDDAKEMCEEAGLTVSDDIEEMKAALRSKYVDGAIAEGVPPTDEGAAEEETAAGEGVQEAEAEEEEEEEEEAEPQGVKLEDVVVPEDSKYRAMRPYQLKSECKKQGLLDSGGGEQMMKRLTAKDQGIATQEDAEAEKKKEVERAAKKKEEEAAAAKQKEEEAKAAERKAALLKAEEAKKEKAAAAQKKAAALEAKKLAAAAATPASPRAAAGMSPAVSVDPDDPVFQGKVKAMVKAGLPEAFSVRALVACAADLDKATDLLQEVMGSVEGGSASVSEMPEEELDSKVEELMEEIDTFKSGSISFRQFLSWVKRQQCEATGEKRLTNEMNDCARDMFNRYDDDDACALDKTKMRNVLQAMAKDAMFGAVMESLMAAKMAELEEKLAAAEAEAAAAEAEAARLRGMGPPCVKLDASTNNVKINATPRRITVSSPDEALAPLAPGTIFELSGTGESDGIYTVEENLGNQTIITKELIAGGEISLSDGTISMQTGATKPKDTSTPAHLRLPPDSVVAEVRDNPEFSTSMEEMAMDYVEFQLSSVKIPTIEGEKEWGTYKIENLKIKSYVVAPENLVLSQGGEKTTKSTDREMIIKITDIAVEFGEFQFGFVKNTFPKVQEDGATATISAKFNANVQFKMKVAEGGLVADDVQADITIEEIPITVLQGKHRRLYNMLLKAFSTKVKMQVEGTLKEQVAASGPLLQQKLTEKTMALDVEQLLARALKARQEKAVRMLFVTLNSAGNGRLVAADIADFMTQLDNMGLGIGAEGVEARAGPALAEMGASGGGTELGLDEFLLWWQEKATDPTSGPTAELVHCAMSTPSKSESPLGNVLLTTAVRVGKAVHKPE